MSPPELWSGPPGPPPRPRPRSKRPSEGTLTGSNATSLRARPAYMLSDLPAPMRVRITVDPASGCWLGSPPHSRGGYARWGPGELHRAVWLELVGPIAPRLVLDHREDWGCTSKACCWPGHLLPVTHRVNTLRGRSFAAINAAKDKCDHGHEFDLFNTYWRPNGHRDCRACIRQRVAAYQARRRQQDMRLAA